MKFIKSFLLILIATILFFSGCSKELEEYNKPAVYWYGKIIENISKRDLEKADEYYSSLQGEHIGSPLLPEATMILAIAHMHYEEYLLSEHFLNEYVKRYATVNEKEDADFLKIKAKYMALPNPRRDQALISDAIKEAQKFKYNYPNSMYYAVVDTMQTRLFMAEAALNETIADLYDRLDKPKSAAHYRAIKPQPWIKWDEIDRANSAWYREWFEGDGTSSWYAFMIPDTKSVVSRNSVPDSGLEKKIEQVQKVQPQKQKQQLSTFQESELAKAKELRDKGILSDAEYQTLKEKILEL
ncbi:outer membrane protein assembly factor BamD [Sulfurimonas sp.]|uniref:outer membrane protein assembly factor BamD n=1 Tax=Sulfurimonas sp. TaxID=2022749 RepID=UPI002AB053E0|nr:outer membrane protein assembly factor BamD [Sulfurimonas sp.]